MDICTYFFINTQCEFRSLARDGADARTVTALDLKHGTLFGTPMTWLLSHAATLRNCGVLHLDVESKHLILDAALF